MTPEERYAEALRRIENAKQTGATELNLFNLKLSQIPAKILDCSELQSLNLSKNQISQIENLPTGLQSVDLSENQISQIENLPTGLQSVDLSENQISQIENLPTGLQSLNLSYNKISFLENLPVGLQELNLSNDQITMRFGSSGPKMTLIPGISKNRNQISQVENLPDGLQSLNLSNNQIRRLENLPQLLQSLDLSDSEIRLIENLPRGLQSLNLSENQIGRLENLPSGLQSLNLSGNQINQLENIPTGMQNLNLSYNQISQVENLPSGLQSLDLRSNQIGRLENLPGGLQSLILSDSEIRQIENLPEGLQSLDLSYNQIRQIENLPEGLQSLNLSKNQISQLENLPEELQLLEIISNPTENVPPELLGEGFQTNCLEDVRAWFADLAMEKVINQAVRLLVTGNGNVGKSSLIEALQQDQCTTQFDSTHAIHIEPLLLAGQKPVTCQMFDFGGQEIYMGTHQLFLRGRAVQLILFDAETEATPQVSDRITGEIIRNQPLRHWVRTAQQQSPDSRFVLIQNKMDLKIRADASTEALLAQYEGDGMAVARVSATTGRGVAALRGHVSEAAYALPEYGMEMPASWHRVRQHFIDNLHQPPAQRQRLMARADFNSLCRQHNVLPRSESALLTYLHRSGTLYYSADYLPEMLIADQEWAITAIYAAIDRTQALYERLRNQSYGKCQVRDLFAAFGLEYSIAQRWLLLQFMESCGLCFPLKQEDYEGTNEDTYYIFPEFLPAETPEIVAEFVQNARQSKRIFQQTLEFLPYAHVQQLISRWGLKTHIGNISRTALFVRTTEGRFALTADLQQHTLTLHIETTSPDEWVHNLLKQFAYQNANWQDITTPNVSQPVALRPKSESKTDVLAKTPDVVQPKVRKLVASYAQQDEVFLQVLRKKLSARPEVDFFYDRHLTGRTAWNEELEGHFQTADGYVLFLSDDYIDADNKQFIHEKELPIIQQRWTSAKLDGGLPIVGIKVSPVGTDRIPLLKDYLLFDKGKQMPDPEKDRNGASAFMQEFVDQWVFGEFLK